MKNKIKIFLIPLLLIGYYSCSDFLDPDQDNTMTEERVFENAAYFCGPLMQAYEAIPDYFDIEMDNMTDNSLDTDLSGNYYLGGTGALRPDNNPLDNWNNAYLQIRNINIFLDKMVFDPTAKLPTPVRFFKVGTKADSTDNSNTFFRLLGEAYFLRAYWQSELLRNFGGENTIKKDSISGFPLIGDRILTTRDELNLERAGYHDCVKSIVNDCDSALKYLPIKYTGTSRVTGKDLIGRASGTAAHALKTRVLLYAASPAFNKPYKPERWEDAAIAAGEAIKAAGGLNNLSTIDEYYFTKINDNEDQNRDVIFRSKITKGNQKYEKDFYPQGMYGSVNSSISQNYVDAFPDKDGYPIDDPSSSYLSSDPYSNRDPRLARHVAYNGSRMGPGNYYTINSYKGGADAYVPFKKTSRTSYYLKKLLRPGTITLVTGADTKTPRTYIVLGMPELYLNYAEAANEAWGVKSDPKGFGFTAYDALRKIQTRYNSGAQYLNNVIGTDQSLFRKYLANERRLELSFEGHYYYDLRRRIGNNDLSSINVDVYGMEITKNSNNTYTYKKVFLEKRVFPSQYQPISYMELFNSSKLVQNYGWQ